MNRMKWNLDRVTEMLMYGKTQANLVLLSLIRIFAVIYRKDEFYEDILRGGDGCQGISVGSGCVGSCRGRLGC